MKPLLNPGAAFFISLITNIKKEKCMKRSFARWGLFALFIYMLSSAVVPAVVMAEDAAPAAAAAVAAPLKIDTGDTAWVLVSAALVMLMTPGLAFFYGGLVRRKNMLSVL